jgi:hypothetical protein
MKGKRREETKRRKFTEDENRETRALWSCFVYYNELGIRFLQLSFFFFFTCPHMRGRGDSN